MDIVRTPSINQLSFLRARDPSIITGFIVPENVRINLAENDLVETSEQKRVSCMLFENLVKCSRSIQNNCMQYQLFNCYKEIAVTYCYLKSVSLIQYF